MVHAQVLLTILLAVQLQTGSLTVTAPPGSEVFWEGVRLGTVASNGVLHIGEIPPGEYQIAVRKPGYSPSRRSVSIAAGEQTVAFQPKSPPELQPEPVRPPPKQTDAEPLRPFQTPLPTDQSPPSPNSETMPPSLAVGGGAVEEKSSQIQDTLETPLFWSILVACALLAALFRFLWSQRKVSPEPQLVWENGEEPFPADDASRPSSWPAAPAFLDDLRRREEMVEQGVSDLVRKAREKPIDLGRDDVRSLDE